MMYEPRLELNKYTEGHLMEIGRLVTDVTAVGAPDIVEHAILGVILAGRCVVLSNLLCFCDWGATLWCRNPLLSPNRFTYSHLMKIKWLVADVTAVRSPDRAERTILGVILAGRCFGQIIAYFWSGMGWSYFVV